MKILINAGPTRESIDPVRFITNHSTGKMGYALAKLVSLKKPGEGAQLMTFHIASILPTVVFNGAYWGQCDVIYTSLCLMAVYMGLTRRSARSMIFFGLALAFKLQTVFFLPVMLPLLRISSLLL